MRFKTGASKGSIFMFLMVLSVASIAIGPRLGALLRPPAQAVLAPLSEGGMYLSTMFKAKVHDLGSDSISSQQARDLQAYNQTLAGQADALKAELVSTRRQLATVQKMDHLLFGPLEDIPCELVSARVVGGDSLPYGQTRTLNVRRASAGLPVTTRNLMTDRSKALPPRLSVITPWCQLEEVSGCFLVGRLIDTGEFTARLQLITDNGFSIQARIQRNIDPTHPRDVIDNGVRKTLNTELPQLIEIKVKGDGVGALRAYSVKDDYKVQAGDLLVTCNDDPLLPAQVRIGEVTEVTPATKSGFNDLRIRPLADLAGLREVYVVVPRGGQMDKKDEGLKR
jgi:hypothetical protein